MTWRGLADWWRSELAGDPAYEEEVTPLLLNLLQPQPGWRVLDAGCGEGRVMAALRTSGAAPVGVDVEHPLLASAREFGPVVQASIVDLSFLAVACVDAVVVSLVLEHLEDESSVLTGLARVTRPGGVLAMVLNHPVYTSPESAPIQESDEVLWRPGTYFERGYTDEPAGETTIRFHHRSMSMLLNAASDAGWDLQRLEERGVTDAQIERQPPLAQQRHIPRLLGGRWVRREER